MKKSQALFYILVILIIYLIGAVKIDLMDNDATQYMTIAQNMYKSGDFLTVTWRNDYNYLDKPPLLFWVSAFFFKLFGASPFVYRLPSILINLLGIFSTYKLGKRLFSERAGLFAAIIFASNFGIFVINQDVRTDTLLTGFVIFSIWQLYLFLEDKKTLNLVLGFVGIGFAVSTKGPLGLLIPALALGPHLVYQKRWKDLFRWEWLAGIVIMLVVLIPMIVGTYQQYGFEGLRFHFWDQSFGRITGKSKWVDNSGPFFFLHSFLWSFIPWTIFALFAYFYNWKSLFGSSKNNKTEIITLSGVTLVFLAMSMASYKLPHYVYVVFPLIAIFTGGFIDKKLNTAKWEGFGKFLFVSQTIFNTILWLAVVVSFFLFKVNSFGIYVVAWFAFSYYFFILSNPSRGTSRLFTSSLVTILAVAFILNTHFYPSLNPYQGRVAAGKYLKEKNIAKEEVVIYPLNVHKPGIDVYADMLVPRTDSLGLIRSKLSDGEQLFVFTDAPGRDSITKMGYPVATEASFKDYQISMLSIRFLNPASRPQSLNDLYLLRVGKK